MSKRIWKITGEVAKKAACREILAAPEGWIVSLSEPNRTLDQNAAQWPYLEAFAKQKQLCINGEMQWVTSDDWKDVLTGCWNGEMRMAAFDGKVIMLPQRTSKMGKGAFSTWLEFLIAMSVTSGVEAYPENERRTA
jgi:hypothetical protein